uniref:Glucokinase (hexokinase 4) regulator n=1 Tax=Cyprinus carpio carpio TaxID=630221 RepID=A0A8C1HJI7_CYPCA
NIFHSKKLKKFLIVLSGCGSSGRILFLLAGGDRVLLTSQEAPEDDPALRARTLHKVCAGIKRVLFVGISCGMSAPFVAGQLDFCLKHLDVFTPVLLGFSPVPMARSEAICSFHFKDVAERMTAEQKVLLLNPVLGAEAISGSSRMKGGNATKIILKTILLAGRLTYASECIPTYGAGAVGFINNGFSKMKNKKEDLNYFEGPEFVICHKDFVDTILSSLSQNDIVLFQFTVNDDLHEVTALADKVSRKTSNLHAIAHDLEKFTVPVSKMNFKESFIQQRQHWELSTKWCLNEISTGAHLLKGKDYMNYMIDLRVTNSKLYKRAIYILQQFKKCSESVCERALLRAIYSTDDLSEDMTSADVW